MIRSMTGYGQAQRAMSLGQVTVEIKSLNNKGVDINMRLPRLLSEREYHLRNLLQPIVERGKCIFSIQIEQNSDQNNLPSINLNAAKHYQNQLQALSKHLDLDSPISLSTLLHLPEVLGTINEISEELWGDIENLIQLAVSDFNNFRQTEGSETAKMLQLAINNIQLGLNVINTLDVERLSLMRARLQKNAKELLSEQNFDPNRFEQELIYYIEKLDISEEKQRLQQHLRFFQSVLDAGGAVGKKLGFIAQEVGREINTIGSKANNFEIQQHVVVMKDELEKIKEQLLNLI